VDFGVGVADGVEVGDLAVADVVTVALEIGVFIVVAFAFGVVVTLDVVALVVGVALAAELGVAVFGDVVALDDAVAAGVADDVGAGVGVEEADAFDAGAMATI